MKKYQITIIVFFVFIFLTQIAFSQTQKIAKKSINFENILSLKVYMDQFIQNVSELESALFELDNPDWSKANQSLDKIKKTVEGLKTKDQDGQYKNKINELAKQVQNFDSHLQNKDKNIRQQFDELRNACVNCHMAHRPMDIQIKKTDNKFGSLGY